jgi:hypothetical protein
MMCNYVEKHSIESIKTTSDPSTLLLDEELGFHHSSINLY